MKSNNSESTVEDDIPSWLPSLFKPVISRSICSIYIAISIPLRFAFVVDYAIDFRNFAGFVILDLVSTSFFINEIGWITYIWRKKQLRISPEENDLDLLQEDVVQVDRPRHPLLSIEYLLPIVSSLPLEYISLFCNVPANYFLAHKCFSILYLPKCVEDLSNHLEHTKLLKNHGLRRALKLFFLMALVGHWCCCGFFHVAKVKARIGIELTWPQDIGVFEIVQDQDSRPSLLMLTSVYGAYIQSLYWAYITMVTTGFGDIVPLSIPETIWCIVTMFLGVLITTCAIANLQLLVTNMDAALTNFQLKMEKIKKFMKYRQLSGTLQNRILSCYYYQWDLLRGADEDAFLTELPRSLQQRVANFMYRDLVASLPLLRKANKALLNALADCTEINTFSPNDVILKPGENLRGTLLVSRGVVEVFNGARLERKMKRFDRFAEESLFIQRQCDRTVRARTFSEVFTIPYDEFQKVIKAQCDAEHILQMKESALMITKNAKKANKLFGSAEEQCPTKGFQKYCHPKSIFRSVWNLLCLIGYTFYMFSIPLILTQFLDQKSYRENIIVLILGYLVDIFFLINTYLQYNYFMFYEEGLVVFNQERIRKKFVNENSITNQVISALPLDMLVLAFGSRYYSVLRINKLLHLRYIIKCGDNLERNLADFRGGVDLSFLRVMKLNFVLIVVIHWVGCMWYICASISVEFGLDSNWKQMDEEDQSLSINHSDFGGFSAYLRSVYWAIVGMSTVGYGDIIPSNLIETTFATICILFGGLILPAIVGGLAAYLGNVNAETKSYKRKLIAAKSFMRHHLIDESLIEKVISYFDYLWSTHGAIDEQSIMNELPDPIRQTVGLYMNRVRIESVPLFKDTDDSVKELIVSILTPQVFLPHDMIVNEGDIGTDMYFIEKGEVAILLQRGNVHTAILGRDDYFGESILTYGTRERIASVRALTYCDCFALNKEDFSYFIEECGLIIQKGEIFKAAEEMIQKKTARNRIFLQNLSRHPKTLEQYSKLYFDDGKSNMRVEITRLPIHETAPYHPNSTFRAVWNVVMACIYVYNAWVIPLRFASLTKSGLYWIDWALDTLMFVDMYLHNYMFSFIHHGELFNDVEVVKQRYKSKYLKVDLLTAIPFDAIYLIFSSHSQNSMIMAILRVPKLLRIGRLPTTLSHVLRVLEDANIGLAPLRLVEFLSGVILIAHWAACGFYAFSLWQKDSEQCVGKDNNIDNIAEWGTIFSECQWEGTWIQRQVMNGKLNVDGGLPWQRYIRSFNWALPTLVVVVIGDVVPVTSAETLYAFLWMVLGVTINAAIIGNVANIVANIDTDSSIYSKKVDDLKKYMHKRHVSKKIQQRVNEFLSKLREHGGVQNEDDFIKDLPSPLQVQVTAETQQRHISNCPFFDFCSDDIVKSLSLRLKLVFFGSGDVIVPFGEIGQEMYFLERGTVEVTSRDGKTVFATLSVDVLDCPNNKPSAFFGETSLFFKRKRTKAVRAKTFCEIYQLDKVDLDNELRQRDFNLSRMLDVFTAVSDSNDQRNNAVSQNLERLWSENSKLSKLIDTEEIANEKKFNKLFLPNSLFRSSWDVACIIFTIYYAIAIPVRAAFFTLHSPKSLPNWLIFDFCIDAFFVVDFYLRYYIFLYLRNGTITTLRERTLNEYGRIGKICDLISCFPIEAVLPNKTYIPQSRILHMIRITRLPRFIEAVETVFSRWNLLIDASLRLLIKMFFYYSLVIHWFGCIWFTIHRFMERHVKYTWATTDCPGGQEYASEGCLASWDEHNNHHTICDDGLISRCYIRSVYYVLTTMSTVGYGDISPVNEFETIYQNIVVLVGACFFAGLIGAFGEYLSCNDESGHSAFKNKIQKLQEYMQYRHLPSQLQSDILFFHNNKWNWSLLLDEEAVTSILPIPLQLDLSYEVLGKVIQKFPILYDCSEIVQKRICHSLQREVCPPNTDIYHVGDIGWDIYFISSGFLQVSLTSDLSEMDEEGRANVEKLKTKAESIGLVYRAGNHFGESCLTSQSGVRQEHVRAKTMAELFVISKEGLEQIFGYMAPHERDKVKEDLLSKNGQVWHTFENELGSEKRSSIGRKAMVSKVPSLRRSLKTRFERSSSASSSGSIKSRNNPELHNRKLRLRSFSAEASAQAIRRRLVVCNALMTSNEEIIDVEQSDLSITTRDDT